MNYQKAYDALIAYRKSKIPTGYTEQHHIVPKAFGGSNDKDNLVELTAREHFVAHRFLAKIHGGKMWSALWMMCHCKTTSGKGLKVSSRTYEIAKIKHAQQVSVQFSGENHPNYKRPMSEEQKKKISESLKGRYSGELNPNFGKKHDASTRAIISEKLKGRVGEKCAFYGKKHSDETRKKLSEIRRSENRSGENNSFYGKSHAEETRKRLSEKHSGKTLTDEHREKIAQTIRDRCAIKVQCPHCLRLISKNSINRFHNDNCIMKPND
jgi:flagellar biosynthesis GTPase FlhF